MSERSTPPTDEAKGLSAASGQTRLRGGRDLFIRQIKRPYFVRLAQWQTRNLAASMILALSELPHVLLFLPSAASDAVGFSWYLTQLVCLFMVAGLPIAAVFAAMESRLSVRIDRMNPANLVTFSVGAILACIIVEVLFSFTGIGQSRQFPERLTLLRYFGEFAAFAMVTMLCFGVIRPAAAFVLSRTPNLARPRTAFIFSSFLLLVSGVFAADFALFSIHLDRLVVVIVMGAMSILMLAGFCIRHEVSSRAIKAALIFSGLLLSVQPIGPWRNAHARFVIYNHSPLARSVTIWLDTLVDFDRDQTASKWVGGTDCDDFNVKQNPTRRESPGDGFDQDCSGADSLGKQTPISIRPLKRECLSFPEKPSIILISIEALRASVVRPDVMPNLSRLAAESTRFNRAYTAATYTLYSTMSIFTGRPFTSLTNANPIDNNRYCASDRFTQTLKDKGYRTGFYCHVSVSKAIYTGFDDTNRYPRPMDPLGGELFGGESALMSAGLTNAAMEYVKDRAEQPYFLWMHYTDTHAPYDGPTNTASTVNHLTPYEATAAYVDFHIGRLIDYLDQSPQRSNTVIIVTADHGEDLGQRGKEGHGPALFEESIHVPLFLSIPSCPSRDVNAPVSLTQLAPTIAALGGGSFEGIPLFLKSVPELEVVAESINTIGIETRLLRAFIESQYKLIVDVKNGGRMLFDLKNDPLEKRDIYRTEPGIARRIEQQYQDWLDRADPGWRPNCTPGWSQDGGIPIIFGDEAPNFSR
jgi:arylsulfatase